MMEGGKHKKFLKFFKDHKKFAHFCVCLSCCNENQNFFSCKILIINNVREK